MSHTTSRLVAFVASALLAGASVAQAQCPQPDARFALPRPPFTPVGLAAFDAGAGEQVYASGALAGASAVVRWNGATWDQVYVGSDPAFVGCGEIERATLAGTPVLLVSEYGAAVLGDRILVFDGTTWTALGTVPYTIEDVGVLDDGTGPAITVCGRKFMQPNIDTGYVSRWNGASFVQVGNVFPAQAWAIASVDDGAGPRLHVVGGKFTLPAVPGFSARWDGTAWTTTGSFADRATSLEVFDDGNGPRLYVGLQKAAANGSMLQRWNGASWSPVGAITASVFDLELADFGGGPRLALIGSSRLATSPLLEGLALFDGTNFSSSGAGFQSSTTGAFDLAFVDDGVSRKLYASGGMLRAGGVPCMGFAAWDGAQWSALPGRGLFVSTDAGANVLALTTWEQAGVPKLVAGGNMLHAGGGGSLFGTASWDGSTWSALGTGPVFSTGTSLLTLRAATLPSGDYLYAGGQDLLGFALRGVARFDGSTWSTAGWGNWGDVHAFEVFDFGAGPRLVAGGNFSVSGGAPGNFLMRYDGTSWSAIGSGTNDLVAALAIYDAGSGPELYAAGRFTLANGSPAAHVARWNGVAWQDVGGGVDAGVNALCVFDEGHGSRLYAGGTFTHAGGAPVSYVASWNGATWSDVPGGGADGAVLALRMHDDGRGRALYAGGGFTQIGGIPAANIARCDGSNWEPVAGGTDGPVYAIASFDDDADGDPELFLGGAFANAFGFSAGGIARLEGCPHFTSFCASDGSFADHTTPCPCGNNGAAGHGCANSFVPAGAVLGASGSTFADDVTLTVNDTPQSSFAIYLQHDAQDDRTFHDGVLCAGGHLIRLRNRFSVGGQSSFPDTIFAQDATLTLSQRGQVAPGSGASRYYSLFYRNASSTFCPPALANVSNGVRVIW